MIDDQSQIEGRRTERAIAIDPAMLDFLDTVSVSAWRNCIGQCNAASRVGQIDGNPAWCSVTSEEWHVRGGAYFILQALRQIPSLLGLRVDIAIDLQAREKRGCWSVRGASFVAIHDPFDRVTSTGANYVELPAECASALGIVVGVAALPVPATALFLEPGPRDGVDRLTLLRAIAEVLEAVSVSLCIEIYRGDEFDAVETSGIFSAALRCIDQLLRVVASQTKPIASTRRKS
jgi:starvation-inducible DNA-binding protein